MRSCAGQRRLSVQSHLSVAPVGVGLERHLADSADRVKEGWRTHPTDLVLVESFPQPLSDSEQWLRERLTDRLVLRHAHRTHLARERTSGGHRILQPGAQQRPILLLCRLVSVGESVRNGSLPGDSRRRRVLSSRVWIETDDLSDRLELPGE